MRRSPRATIVLGVVLAYGVGLWLHVLHEVQGAEEAYALSPLTHWLRDSTLALPAMVVAVGLALTFARRLVEWRSWRRLWLEATMAALAAALVFGVGAPVHAELFGDAGQEHEQPPGAVGGQGHVQPGAVHGDAQQVMPLARPRREHAQPPVQVHEDLPVALHAVRDALVALPVALLVAWGALALQARTGR